MIRRILEIILIPITMIGGYAFLIIGLTVLIIAGLSGLIWLHFDLWWLAIGLDVAVIVGMGVLFASEKFRQGLREFWEQVRGNI